MTVSSHRGATPYVHTTNPITGMVAYDGSSQSLKIYDGGCWQTVGGGSANINLSANAISILKWAEKKMLEEREREQLAETNPAIKDLVNQIKEKEEQIKMVQTLLKSSGDEGMELMRP
jgi:hypothetical protein